MPRDAAQSLAHLDAFMSRRRDPATKREAVLKTAAQLFLEKSYGKTSMNDVADRLNITKPALYHYFHNKEEILIECYRLGTGLIEEILNNIADHCGTGLEKVEAFIYSYANVMTVNFGRCVMRLDDADLSSDALTQVRNYKRKIDRRLRSFIQEGIDDGSITPCDAKIAAFSCNYLASRVNDGRLTLAQGKAGAYHVVGVASEVAGVFLDALVAAEAPGTKIDANNASITIPSPSPKAASQSCQEQIDNASWGRWIPGN